MHSQILQGFFSKQISEGIFKHSLPNKCQRGFPNILFQTNIRQGSQSFSIKQIIEMYHKHFFKQML